MPGFDRTGPLGNGPMSGRGMGNCHPMNRGIGRGIGRGFGRGFGGGYGRGFGRGRGYGGYFGPQPVMGYAPPADMPAQELAALKAEAQMLHAELAQINERIAILETEKE